MFGQRCSLPALPEGLVCQLCSPQVCECHGSSLCVNAIASLVIDVLVGKEGVNQEESLKQRCLQAEGADAYPEQCLCEFLSKAGLSGQYTTCPTFFDRAALLDALSAPECAAIMATGVKSDSAFRTGAVGETFGIVRLKPLQAKFLVADTHRHFGHLGAVLAESDSAAAVAEWVLGQVGLLASLDCCTHGVWGFRVDQKSAEETPGGMAPEGVLPESRPAGTSAWPLDAEEAGQLVCDLNALPVQELRAACTKQGLGTQLRHFS